MTGREYLERRDALLADEAFVAAVREAPWRADPLLAVLKEERLVLTERIRQAQESHTGQGFGIDRGGNLLQIVDREAFLDPDL